MKRATSPPQNPSSAEATSHGDLAGREVLVAVCGGIAAFKTAAVVSALVQRGCGVSVAMTAAAQRFVAPLTFEALSGRRVHVNLWDASDEADPQHLHLTEDADLVVVAPATANILGKMALGLADDLVSTLLVAAVGPILIAPAMNTRMWENAAVQRNVELLRACGHSFVGPGSGWMACRTVGVGRMAEPDEIVARAAELLTARNA
jgi:phosphopantothenoylcysteine decarboxylase/phosphopantothenate--cysteine ligase